MTPGNTLELDESTGRCPPAAGRQMVRKDGSNGYRDLTWFAFNRLVWRIFTGFQVDFGRWDGEGTKKTLVC